MKLPSISPAVKKWFPWVLRFALGVALGFGVRMFWERKPSVRFATGLAWKTATGKLVGDPANAGRSVATMSSSRRSLDALAAADDPASELRKWREEFQSLPPDRQAEWLNQAVEASAGGVRSILARLGTDAALRAEFSEWLDVIEEIFLRGNPEQMIRSAFRELARLDAGLALDGAEASEYHAATEAVFEVLAEDDPKALIELAGRREVSNRIIEMAVASLAARSLDEAMPLLMQYASDDSMAAIARIAASRPTEEAFGLCRDEAGQLDASTVEMLARQVPAYRAGEFFRTLEKLAPDIATAHARAAGTLLQKLARFDPAEAIQWVEKNWLDARDSALEAKIKVLGAAGESEPAVAAAALGGLVRDPKSRMDQLAASQQRSVLQHWVARDAEAALEFALAHPQLESAELEPWQGFFARLPSEKFESIATRLEAIPDGRAKSVSQRYFFNIWASTSPAEAYAYAESLADPDRDSDLKSSMLSSWMASDPDAALEVAKTLTPDERSAILIGFADSASAPAAVKLLETDLGCPPEMCGALANGFAAQIAFGNHEQVLKAFERLPENVKGTVAAALSHTGAAIDSGLAPQFLNHIDDPVARMEVETRLLRQRWVHR